MPYDSRTYRVLIASPSDVEEEREIAVRVVQEWNDLHSYSRKVVLLPLRWETHTAPEYGVRPQEVINRAIVDNCDLLVGVFWTRIGTPTGIADSGTLEEIERVAKAGKSVMLYFSKIGMDPDKIDLGQLARLQTFKEQTYPNALTEAYKSQIEFRDKFAKQLEMKIRELEKTDTSREPPPLNLGFALHDREHLAGPALEQTLDLITPVDLEPIVALEPPERRERIERAVSERIKRASTAAVLLAIQNSGSSGIRNLYIEMLVQASSDIEVLDRPDNAMVDRWFSAVYEVYDEELPAEILLWRDKVLRKTDKGWEFSFECDALQPQRVRLIRPRLFIRADCDAHAEFTARVFADSFPEPVPLKATLNLVVRPKECVLSDVVPDLDALRKDGLNVSVHAARK